MYLVPPVTISDERTDYDVILLSDQRLLNLDEVKLEYPIEDIKPDIIAKIGERKLLIEIAVTHFIDENKLQKIKDLGISTIEIDLRKLKDGFTKEELSNLVIEEVNNKKWIYNSKENDLLEEFFKKNEQFYRERDILFHEREKRIIKQKSEAKKKCYDIISSNDDNPLHCPMLMHKNTLYMKHNEIINSLKEGNLWNGILYGQKSNGTYIYINGKKIEIFPKDTEFNLSTEEVNERRKIYGQLRWISEKSSIFHDKCFNCQFFGDYIDTWPISISCGFRTQMKLNSKK